MQTRYRRAAVTLALAAMLLRALLPAGWMPNPDGFAQSPLVICPMDTPSGLDVSMPAMDMSADAPMDMSHMDMHGHSQHQTSEPCSFAAAPHLAASGGAFIGLAAPSVLALFVHKRFARTSVSRGAVHHPQSPRAPPAFA